MIPAGLPDLGEAGGRFLDILAKPIHQPSGLGSSGMEGDPVEQVLRFDGSRGEGLSGTGVSVGNEIASQDLKIRRPLFHGSRQNHQISIRAKLVRGFVHTTVGQ